MDNACDDRDEDLLGKYVHRGTGVVQYTTFKWQVFGLATLFKAFDVDRKTFHQYRKRCLERFQRLAKIVFVDISLLAGVASNHRSQLESCMPRH